MKTRYAIKALGLILSLCATVLWAQEQGLNREMTLEREYDPSVKDANKVNTLPAVKEPVAAKSSIDYAFMSIPVDPKREIGIISAGKFMTETEYDKHRGYLNFGAGNYWNVNVDAGYHILSTEKDILNVYLSHRSTNGDVKYIDGIMKDSAVRAKINDNLAGLGFLHNFQKASLKLNAKYGYSSFNYYGMPVQSIISKPDKKDDQVNQQVFVETGVASVDGASPLDYNADLYYNSLNYKYIPDEIKNGLTEHNVGLKFGTGVPMGGSQRLGINTKFEYFGYNLTNKVNGFESFFTGRLMPYYLLEGEFWNFKAGVNIFLHNNEKWQIFASPNVGIDLNLGSRTVLYANAGGEMKTNNLYQLSQENRYVSPAIGASPSRTLIDAIVGLKSGVAPGFWFNLFGGYKYTADDIFHIPHLPSEGFYNTVGGIKVLDSRHMYGGLELKYAWQRLFEVTIKGLYNKWEVFDTAIAENLTSSKAVSSPKPYGKPKVEANAGLTVRPVDPLSLYIGYNLLSGRYSYKEENKKMEDIHELNLTGSYSFSNSFGVYLKCNNLLFKQYELFYGYPLQGFSVMGGFNFNF